MPTWNSYTKYFPLIIDRVVSCLNPHHFIVIDRYSTDKTIETIRSFVPKDRLKLIRTNANLQVARKLGVDLADTEIIGFIDSDVLIPRKLKEIIPIALTMLRKDYIGAISFSLHDLRKGGIKASYRTIKSIDSITNKEVLYHGINQLCRGYMFLCFLKRNLLQDLNLNPLLSAFEDFSISQHILKKGYYWVELKIPLLHMKEAKYKGLVRFLRQGLWEGANLRIVKIDTSKVLLTILGRLVGGLLSRHVTQFITYVGYIIGYLNYHAFRIWKR